MANVKDKDKTAPKNEVALRPIDAFRQELVARRKAFVPMLPRHIPVEKFEAAVIAAVASNPKLLECNKASMFKACAEAAELGLSLNPSLRECDILQVWNSRISGYEAQFRPRFMGLMKLARQSGEIRNIYAHVVREGDQFDYELGLDKRLVHKTGGTGDVTHAYCVWEDKDGMKSFEVMDIAQLRKIMMRSSSKNKAGEIVGPWVTDFEEMCRKTVVRRSAKYMPMSPDKPSSMAFANAVRMDDLREGGHEASLDNGAVIDITGSSEVNEPAEPPKAPDKTASQLDKLSEKLAPEKPKEPVKKAPPAEDVNIKLLPLSGADIEAYTAWVKAAELALVNLTPDLRKRWAAMHSVQLEHCEMNAPDLLDGIQKLLA